MSRSIDVAIEELALSESGRRHFREATAGLTDEHLSRPAALRIVLLSAASTVEAYQKMRDQIAAMEKRIAEFEASGIKYCGGYQRAMAYRKGSLVTHGGSAWCALRDVAEGDEPGKQHDAWQMAVKAGRDGKDVRP